ncbi:CBM1 domain-containing protein [Favolaschia claudopus]|uniref:CBM1 domain-containing protein n=1 Tax=Favolaschia claudopus TaxID=2862362 RepID=A0AAW0BUX6_9AGAR
MAESSNALRSKLSLEILYSVILSNSRTGSNTSFEDLANLQKALTVASLDTANDTGELPVTFAEGDIERFVSCPDIKEDAHTQRLIAEEMDSLLEQISSFCPQSASPEGTSQDLCDGLLAHLNQMKSWEEEADVAQRRIKLLLEKIEEIHPRLQRRLTGAIEKFAPEMASRRSANNDLLAMTIEASLVKVSFVRAQALESLYNYSSPKNPKQNMGHTLSVAYAKLKEEDRELKEEELKLDRELAEYQTLIDMVDGRGNAGFKQIVADTARVEKETEECRRDLRRLGWTG